jgi:hypothetical protein
MIEYIDLLDFELTAHKTIFSYSCSSSAGIQTPEQE